MASDRFGISGSPLGTGPYGYGTPAVGPALGGVINRASNGLQYGSPHLSLDQDSRGQYVFDEFGRRKGQPDVRHMVTLALATVRGSCVVPSLGHRFKEVRKVTDAFPQEQRTRVEEALAPILQRGLITLNSVTVEPRFGHPSITSVQMTDLSNGVVFEQLI